MVEKKNTPDLYSMISASFDNKKENFTPEDYKYIVYIRKSTDEDDKQVRSIDDQIAECKEYAKRNNLYIKKIVQEKQSAKEPGIRPVFSKMLDDIKDGVYDGIIAWHPDRLARNMKEAGEIIDLLDRKEILDLSFPSYTFTNDTSGKMTLGITFVLSKQYSDKLSDDVKRGIRRATLEGKYINTVKHGYVKNKHQQSFPDKKNFNLIEDAFQMRLKGDSLDKIAKYLNDSGYTKKIKKTGEEVRFIWNKKKVSELLSDTFYAGVQVYGGEVIKQSDFYDFTQAVSEEDFLTINKSLNFDNKKFSIKQIRDPRKTKAVLLNGKVFCSECEEKVSTGITTKKKDGKVLHRRFYYRCNTRECSRYNKSTRAKVIVDYVKEFLNSKPFSNQHSFDHYKEEMARLNAIKVKERTQNLRNLQSQKRSAERLIKNTKKYILANQGEDKELLQSFEKDFRQAESSKKSITKRITKLKDEIEKKKDVILTYKDFLELWSKAVENIEKIENMEQLDKTIRKLFSNFYVSSKKVEKSTLSGPFDKLKDPEGSKVSMGGR